MFTSIFTKSRHFPYPEPDGSSQQPVYPFVFKILFLLKPNDIYICRSAALTSRCYILNIYSKNIHTEYFKHAA